MEQVATFSEVNRHPLGRIVSTAYYSLVKVDEMNVDPSLNGAFWLDVNDIGDLAFDHNQIFEVCYERLKRTLREKPIGFSLLPERFTLKQLQALYEVILGIKLDKRNFRRKLRSLEILIEHEESETDVAHRPAKLYSFNKELYYARRSEGLNFDL